MKENQEEPRDKAKKITKPDPKTKEKKKRGRKNIKEQKSKKKKQKWSNGEFDNKNENRRIAREIRGNVGRGKREIGKRERAGSPLFAKVCKSRNFGMAEGILMVAESKTQDRRKRKRTERRKGR